MGERPLGAAPCSALFTESVWNEGLEMIEREKDMILPNHIAHTGELSKKKIEIYNLLSGERLSDKFVIIFADALAGYFVEWVGRNEDGSTNLKIHSNQRLKINKLLR